MNFVVKTSLGILFVIILVYADVGKSNIDTNEQCQALNCNSMTEICRINSKCDDASTCVYCAPKDDFQQNSVSKTLLASSISQQQQPLAPRLLAKSGGTRLLADNRGDSTLSSTKSSTVESNNKTTDEVSYDDYYEYDEDETSDKNEFGEEDEYLDDYAESIDSVIQGSEPIRKLGVCPKVVQAVGKCDSSKTSQSDCRFDTDCSGNQKCCEAACGKRVCQLPVTTSVSVCPLSFTCSLNCRLGYRTDSNGCLLCECQSCPPMDQCNKNCPSGYLKDLFGCDICECSDQCPPFSCGIQCPADIGFAKSSDGCPLCQCATTKSKPTKYTFSCQDDVHCPPGFRCLNDARNVPMCQAVPDSIVPSSLTEECPDDFATTCKLQCSGGKYSLDAKGCQKCECADNTPVLPIGRPECPLYKCVADCGNVGYKFDANGCRTCECVDSAPVLPVGKPECPLYKCRSCGEAGYKIDENGCQTCECGTKETKPGECSRVMCRMYCFNGFSRDENGCEICKCNTSPKPCPVLNCQKTCTNGYRKDYSGCQTCQCQCPSITCPNKCAKRNKKDENGCTTCSCEEDDESKPTIDPNCSPMKCNLDCKYGYERDQTGCEVCSCNQCPPYTCRMFCMYGFKKNNDGCDLCECDWTPVSENIQCSERIPCTGNRVCNLNLKLCELVSADKVNWFLYDFEIKSELFNDPQFVSTFKNGLINNIAFKYDLESTQITVSSVEEGGLTSFQIMPFYMENPDDFEKKMDQIDIDLNSHEFRKTLPSVVRETDPKNNGKPVESKWTRVVRKHPGLVYYLIAVLLGIIAFIFAGVFVLIFRHQVKHPNRSESKSPIVDPLYHQAPTDDDHYHAVHAPDGTAYVVVESEDMQASNDKRALV